MKLPRIDWYKFKRSVVTILSLGCLVFLLIIICALCRSCVIVISDSISNANNVPRKVYPDDYIEYINFDNHEYVFIDVSRGISLSHSPNCKCLNKEGD